MSEQTPLNRRNFLQALALTGGAAVLTGTGAALIAQYTSNTPPPAGGISPLATLPPLTNPSQADLFAQLTAVQAENLRLQTALDAAERRLALFNEDKQPSEALQQLQLELASSQEQVSVLAGLVVLYEQLTALEWETLFNEGSQTVSEAWQTVTDVLPSWEEGVTAGETALAEFEGQLPLVENGWYWLNNQLQTLNTYYQAVEEMLKTAVEGAGPVLTMLQEWFTSILAWLPFGMGQNAQKVMTALTNLMELLPATIFGLNTNVQQPLNTWLQKESLTAELPLQTKLVKPLREQLLTSAQTALTQTKTAQTEYDERLVKAMAPAVAHYRQMRQQITLYQEKHQL